MEFWSMAPSQPDKARRGPRRGHGGPKGEGRRLGGVGGAEGWEMVMFAWMVKVGFRYSDTSGYRSSNWC
jgi:hypothetical protein